MIDSIIKKDNSYEVAEVLLLEMQKLSEEKALLELEIVAHKKAHTEIAEGLERKTHEIIHISHQMRTSLSGLLGFTQFLKSTSLNEEQHILVVDDNEINKRLLAKVLENEDLEVSYASNGEEAVRLRKENNFDIIFMDIQMPVMDGVDASKAICKYENKNNIAPMPIIVLTANTGKNDRDSYLDAGMTDYMAKPIMIEEVRNRIAQL